MVAHRGGRLCSADTHPLGSSRQRGNRCGDKLDRLRGQRRRDGHSAGDRFVSGCLQSARRPRVGRSLERTGFVHPPNGETIAGQAALATTFTSYFAKNPSVRLELMDTEVDVISPSVAIESGLARVISPDEEPFETEYEAIHVRSANGWKIDSITEAELEIAPVSNYEHLQELEWMVGDWVDGDDSGWIETSCHWTTNKNFLVRSFNVLLEGKLDFSGTQIIGWDPVRESIRSWVFDSEGGFGVGRWSGSEGNWTVNTLNTLADERFSSSTNTYQSLDEDSFTFTSMGRQVDGELLPNIDPVKVVRKTD